MTKWTYDEAMNSAERLLPMATIYVAEHEGAVQTLDLRGAHTFLNLDMKGNLVSVEILGPAVYHSLDKLGDYLMEPPSNLESEEEEAGVSTEESRRAFEQRFLWKGNGETQADPEADSTIM